MNVLLGRHHIAHPRGLMASQMVLYSVCQNGMAFFLFMIQTRATVLRFAGQNPIGRQIRMSIARTPERP